MIEVALSLFTFDSIQSSYETLIDPQIKIPDETIAIHNITDEMVQGKPKIQEILPEVLKMIGNHIIIGHGISLDIQFLMEEAKRHRIPCHLDKNLTIDTLRLARLYGQTPVNSLARLRQHFNIPEEGAHRAMSDVIVNIEVFKHLCSSFKTTKEVFERLKKPICLKVMPLGKYKGRVFADIPIEYLTWAIKKDFDDDLLFSIRSELKKRKNNNSFHQASSPFAEL